VNERFRFDLEQAAAAGAGPQVGGADEAGRGAIAGPLMAAAVTFDYTCFTQDDYAALDGVNDSKRLTRRRREELYVEILLRAGQVVCVACCPISIDGRGLQVCNLDALAEALRRLQPPPPVLLVDGMRLGAGAPAHRVVVGGDGLSAAIAAASIVAKVTRDRLMTALHQLYPQWGFSEHVGYGTAGHHEAIACHGICMLHRRSFQSVAYRQLDLGLASSPGGTEGARSPDDPAP
jgi:ribonuclease HII